MSTPVTALPAMTATGSLDDRPRSRRSRRRHARKSHSSLPTLEQNPVTPVQQEHETTDRSTGPKARRSLFAVVERSYSQTPMGSRPRSSVGDALSAFDMADTNGDGVLSREEFDEWLEI